MLRDYFITGTDTEVGKTEVTLALMEAYKKSGRKVMGMKPVASGCHETGQGLMNEDAERINELNDISFPYSDINPYAFAPAIAPHIAAEQANTTIDVGVIEKAYSGIANSCSCVIVEGAGGWRVPLGDGQTMSDIPKRLQLRVILVVGLRLGCINHAQLSAESIKSDQLSLAGWVANQIEPEYKQSQETVDHLSNALGAPLLGYIPFMKSPDTLAASNCLDLGRLV